MGGCVEKENFRFLKDSITLGVTLFVLYLLIGCAVQSPQLVLEDKFYSRNASFEVNGLKGFGTLVAPRAASYDMRIRSEADMDFLLIQTCGREVAIEKAGDDFKYTYTPNVVETTRACPIQFFGVEKGKNRRTVGWMDMEDPRHVMPGDLCCNGTCRKTQGVSACESGAGLIQRLTFPGPMIASSPDLKCKIGSVDGSQVFEFKIPRGECLHVFAEKAAPHRTHRLSTYGFDETLPMKGR